MRSIQEVVTDKQGKIVKARELKPGTLRFVEEKFRDGEYMFPGYRELGVTVRAEVMQNGMLLEAVGFSPDYVNGQTLGKVINAITPKRNLGDILTGHKKSFRVIQNQDDISSRNTFLTGRL